MTEATPQHVKPKEISVLQAELDQNPDDVSAHTRLGWALYSLEKYEQAVTAFKKAHERWPDEIEVNYGLGLAYKMLGDTEKSLQSFERAESIEPDSVRSSMLNTLAAEQKEYLLGEIKKG
ncbi:MAG: tetratricopeptide repeat protein [Anaerolineales bacterium]|jgi:tetratricopeptide (TPR) repeat protein